MYAYVYVYAHIYQYKGRNISVVYIYIRLHPRIHKQYTSKYTGTILYMRTLLCVYASIFAATI